MSNPAPNRVVLISRGRHDEAVAGADAYPGMLGLLNASGQIIPHNIAGGPSEPLVYEEDAWQGGDITQKLNNGYVVPFRRAAKGDLLTMLLQNGQNVASGVNLMSAGDGTLIANPGPKLYEITAPSTVVTNVGTETTFSNGTYTIPANFLQVGDVLHVRAKAFCVAENSTNTHRVRAYVGSTTLADSTALQLAANDIVYFDFYLTVRTITASGTAICSGTIQTSVSGTFTTGNINVASFTLDSTAAQTLKVTTLASATSAGNQIRLDEYVIELDRAAGLVTVATSAEAINNSGGTGTSGFNSAALIRCLIP